MFPERKKAVGVILSKYGKDGKYKDGGEVRKTEELEPGKAALHEHASDMISAFHNKNPSDLLRAMNNFLDQRQLHQDKDDESPSDYAPHTSSSPDGD